MSALPKLVHEIQGNIFAVFKLHNIQVE